MSYCRWSSDNWTSAVYVYEDVYGGWTIHVASRKRIPLPGKPAMPLEPEVDWSDEASALRWYEVHKQQMAWLGDEDNYTWEDLPGCFAGESFNVASPGECADLLEDIRKSGLNVPQHVIDVLREEQQELE